jgi:predicted TIM-barrel fold metal-dependent hydrolase
MCTAKKTRAIALLAAGQSARQVGTELKINHHTISRWLREDAEFAAAVRAEVDRLAGEDLAMALSVMRDQMADSDPLVRWRAANSVMKHHAAMSVKKVEHSGDVSTTSNVHLFLPGSGE